jgi:hypothetical protein
MVGIRLITASLIVLGSALPSSSAAAEEQATDRRAVEALIAKLSADTFPVRDDARRRLLALGASPAAASIVRQVVEAGLAAKPRDWETRTALEEVLCRLPAATSTASKPDVMTPAVIDAIFADLESNRFVVREAAAERLGPAAKSPRTCGLVMQRIKSRFEKPGLDLESLRRLLPRWNDAWATWLANPAEQTDPPAPDELAITKLIDQLVAPVPAGAAFAHPMLAPYAAAERELLYLLARDDTFSRVRTAMEQRLDRAAAEGMPRESHERLQNMYDWSRPAMVAEYWQNGRHMSIQHLLIGVPNHPEGSPRPSLFDRCDEKTAHCVSGNSLSPGDWPVGIFFPHPLEANGPAQFHLKNLPTPRRRLSYEHEVPTVLSRERQITIDSVRRKLITRQTCEYFLARKQTLDEREIEMLMYVDPDEVSKFAGRYLQNIDDVPMPIESRMTFGNGSSHGMFCYQLAQIGTAEAAQAIAAAIDKNRVLEPNDAGPFRMEWLCLLDLTERVEWPGCDEWLAAQIDRTEHLDIRSTQRATSGASAAALLLRRHEQDPSAFDLERRIYDELRDLGNPGYRFTTPEGPAKVEKWWREAKEVERKASS